MNNAIIRVVTQNCTANDSMSEAEVQQQVDEIVDTYPDITRWVSRAEVIREIADADRFYHLDEEEVELECDNLDDDELAAAIVTERVANMLEDWGSPIGRSDVEFEAVLEQTMATTY